MQYFQDLIQLLKTEREEDKQQYAQLTQNTSVQQNRDAGLAWYPVAIRGTELGRGDYLSVELERTTHRDLSHQLRFGVQAKLFSNHNAAEDFVEGTIGWQSGNVMKLSLRTDELPEWTRNGKLGVELLFDDNSYEEMLKALKNAEAVWMEGGEEARLIKVLTGVAEPTFNTDAGIANALLNEKQLESLNLIVAANEIAIIHGPPGTGKTTTLVQVILALVAAGSKQILVTAPSNTAVDLLSEKLSASGLNVVRVGNPARVSEDLVALTLDSRMNEHPAIKEIKKLKKQASEYRNMAHKYKRNFGKAERDQRKALFDEAHKLIKEASRTEDYIITDVLNKAQVIAATLVGANHYTVRNRSYDVAVIDEAGQALEPACWIPILKSKKLILAGDHCQLPPTIKSFVAAKGGLATTLLEKGVALYPQAVTLLEEQYRMHQQIMGYSSEVFYHQKLKAHESVAEHLLFSKDDPLLFIDTAGCGYNEVQEGTRISNPEEAAFLLKQLSQLIRTLPEKGDALSLPSVAIISPYKQQVQVLRELLEHDEVLKNYAGRLHINTIDGFQGQERDVVYISLVRSNGEGTIGFLNDVRRMNVAMTRARRKLVVIGDSGTLSQLAFYENFISHCQTLNAYHSAWEFMEEA